jgi:hypothetical protein
MKGRQTWLTVVAENDVPPHTPRGFCAKSSQSVENKGSALQKVIKSPQVYDNNRDKAGMAFNLEFAGRLWQKALGFAGRARPGRWAARLGA